MKECVRCLLVKPRDDFYRCLSALDGLQRGCKLCDKARHKGRKTDPEYLRQWRRRNPGYNARRALKDPERFKRQYWKDPEAKRAKTRLWSKLNPHKAAANAAKRRAMKMLATPSWLNQAEHAEIEGQYHFASVMSAITGQRHEVDHEIPLQGRKVCGLHVPTNLRTITESENRRKHNTLSEERFEQTPSLRQLIQEAERLAG